MTIEVFYKHYGYREPLKTQFERKRAIHAVYCVKPPNRAPARLRRLSLYPTQLSHFLFSKRFLEVPIINVSSTTALWQLLFRNPQCGLRRALKIHFQRIFKADTFLDVKLIPTYGRTKVQEKFDYFGIFLALLQPRTGFKLRYEACSRLMSRH